jgi:hypothetical protein
MIIKDSNIFDRYIQASKVTGLKYFSYVSTSWESGTPGSRTPRLTVEYSKDVSVSFYKNMCNEFTYHHRTAFEYTGLYDTQFRDPFDIDLAYRESQTDYAAPFWWFADVTNSDKLIENNPTAVSRLQADRPDGSREQRIQEQWKLFNEQGFINAPISGYMFKKDSLENMNPQKLFNYILQNLETSTNIGILLKIHKILAGKNTKIVLYTYDSFLLDWDEDEEQELEQIKNIFKEMKLSIKINGGKNYDF